MTVLCYIGLLLLWYRPSHITFPIESLGTVSGVSGYNSLWNYMYCGGIEVDWSLLLNVHICYVTPLGSATYQKRKDLSQEY